MSTPDAFPRLRSTFGVQNSKTARFIVPRLRAGLHRSKYHSSAVVNLHEAPNKPVRLVTDCYPVCASLCRLQYLVGQPRRNGPVAREVVLRACWVAYVDSADVYILTNHDEALPLIKRELEVLGQGQQ
ncbi:hypothetical protein ACAX43_28710 [Paraburkholderia sp. IW21]